MGQVVRMGDQVVKTYAGPSAERIASEARGLRRLAAAGAPVPEVLGVHPEGLVLAFVPAGPRDPEALGRAIAALHATPSPLGSDGGLYIGPFRLPDGTGPHWGEHWWQYRIRPLLEACRPALGDLAHQVEAVTRSAPWGVAPPVLLHGDLWAGNVLDGLDGPVFIDPSCQGGHAAVDLGMMALFGGFGARVMAAYREIHRPQPSLDALIPVAQLYFALVHVHAFGRSYVSMVDGLVRRARASR